MLVLSVAAARTAEQRDVGAGLVVLEADRPSRSRLLTSLPAFAVRRTLRPLTVWAAGVGAYFLLIGLAGQLAGSVPRRERPVRGARRTGGLRGPGTVEGYAAAVFSLLAVPVGLFAVGRIAADAADEEARRLALVLSLPVARQRWVFVHAGVAAAAGVVLAVVAGLTTRLGAVAVGATLSAGESLAGVLNVVPAAALGLDAAALAFGCAPSHDTLAGAVPVVGGFVLLVLADSLGWDTARPASPFAHVASVPATGPDLAAAAVMLGLTVAAVLAGARAFARRDVTHSTASPDSADACAVVASARRGGLVAARPARRLWGASSPPIPGGDVPDADPVSAP